MTATPIIEFPDVEKVLCGEFAPDGTMIHPGYLRPALAANGYPGTFVSNRRETQATAVWVRRDGGPTLDVVRENARVGINVFAPTEQAVSNLARTVSALVRAAADGAPIVKVIQSAGPMPIPDASPRRYMTFEVWVRGAEFGSVPDYYGGGY